MVKALITSSFPSTAEVARKLGMSASRIRHVAELMDLNGGMPALASLSEFAKEPQTAAARRTLAK